MPVTSYTSLLGLALPTTGDLSGTWGDTVNNSITSLLDSAVAGTTTLSTDTDVTLTTTQGSSNQSRQQILLCSGSRTVQRTITAPAASKVYVIINATTGGFAVKIVGAGPTTGVTVANGRSAVVAWNGSDFVTVASNDISTLSGTLGVANGGTGATTLTANNVILGNGTSAVQFVAPGTNGNVLTSNGTTWTSAASAASGVSSFSAGTTGFTPSTATTGAITLAGTLAVANGGTGQTTYTNGQLLIGNSTGNTLTKASLTAGSNITITPGSGSITIAASGGFSNIQVFTAPGTWTCPPTTTVAKVTVVGGGGGGSNGTGAPPNPAATLAGGGGGGGAIVGIFPVSTPQTITVGSGGTAGAATPAPGTTGNGGAGGTSSFGSIASATGGSGGATTAPYVGAPGGAGSAPAPTPASIYYTVSGQPGSLNTFSAPTTNFVSGSGGGSSLLGAGGYNGWGTTPSAIRPGFAGTGYGGGGGAGFNNNSPVTGAAYAGGAGSGGVVIVEY